jgi:ribosomal protein L29
MKTKELQQSIKEMNAQQLIEKLDELNRMLFSLRLNRLTTHIKDYSQFPKLRKDIARLRTEISMRQQQIQGAL